MQRLEGHSKALLFTASLLLLPACKDGDDGLPGPSAGSGISYDNSTSGLAATSVQDAIDELDHRVDLLEQLPADTVHLELTAGPLSYTVPAGQTLVVTYLRASSSSPISVAGALAGYAAGGPCKLVVGAGESVTAPNNGGDRPRVHGYLVPSAKAPGTAVHVSGADYTVPAGKTLFITRLASPPVVGATDIRIEGSLVLEDGIAPQGENVSIPVTAGKVVSASGGSAAHGYLR